jgi:hypothetical protein
LSASFAEAAIRTDAPRQMVRRAARFNASGFVFITPAKPRGAALNPLFIPPRKKFRKNSFKEICCKIGKFVL